MGDGGGGFFRGTSMDQDARFSNKEKKLIASMKFPAEYNTKVDMHKVNLEVIKPWIGQQITDLLKFEDEVLIGYVYGLLEEKQFPDPRLLQIRITGFLEQDSSQFCLNLWKLLMSAQNSLGGVPPQFLAKKKTELLLRKAETERIRAGIAKKSGALEGGNEEEVAPKVDEEAQKKQADSTIEKLNKKYKNVSSDEDDWHSRKSKKRRSSSRSRSRSPRDRRDSRRREDRRDSRDDRHRSKRSRRSPSDERRRDRRDSRDYRRRSDSRDRRGRSSSRDRRRRDRSNSKGRRNRSDSREKRGRSTSRDKRRSSSRDRKGKSSSRSASRSKSPVREKSPVKEMSPSKENSTDSYEQELREKALASLKDKKQ
jgi:serine/arginine repetitive matrix protein 1